MFFLLAACAQPDDSAASPSTDELVSVTSASPILPEGGSDYDPRLLGCSVTMDTEDTAWTDVYVHDELGRLVEAHHTSADTTQSTYFTWDGGCLAAWDSTTAATDGSIVDQTYSATCDASGNPVSEAWMADGVPDGSAVSTLSYAGELLVGATGTYTAGDGQAYAIDESWAWSGRWLAGHTYEWSQDGLGVRTSATYTSDTAGQLNEADETECTIFGVGDCVATLRDVYTYDGDARVIGETAGWSDVSFYDDGTWSVDDTTTVSVTYSTGESGVPSSSVYTWDDGTTYGFSYTLDCD